MNGFSDFGSRVAEAQFASQFNGIRSVQQIAKNLRLDMNFARLRGFFGRFTR